MRAPFLIVLFLSGTQISSGAFERVTLGGRSIGLAGSLSTVGADLWSIQTNPSCMAGLNFWELSLFHAPHPFAVDELTRSAFVAAGPVGDMAVGFFGSRFGFDLYRETELTIGIAPRGDGNFRWGCSITRYQLSIESYGDDAGFMLSAGAVLDLSPEISVGGTMRNIFAATIGQEREPLPRSFSLGALFSPVRALRLTGEMTKEFDRTVEWRFGLEYVILESIALRCGLPSSGSSLGAGIGIAGGPVEFDYGMNLHAELGASHAFSISMRLEGW